MTSTSVRVLAEQIAARQRTAGEVVRETLAAIDAANPTLNACLDIFHTEAPPLARVIDERLAAGDSPGPLAGVPVALKDNICLAWGRTTCGSRFLESFRSPFTASAAQRLIDAGAIPVAKTNLDEFAMGSSTELSAFGPTRNPHDHSRVAGGSSGGSAAAVAAGLVPLALGSDTGGSVRLPASYCGCVGLKPTYGRVSRYGLVAYASSLDQVGTLTGNVADAALALQIIAGPDPHDATTSARPSPDLIRDLEEPIDRLVVGVPREARSDALHPAVQRTLDETIARLVAMGASIREVALSHAPDAIAAYYLVASAEASSNLARFDGVRYGRRAALGAGEDLTTLYARSRSEGFGPEVQRRIMLGTYALSTGYYEAYYATAMKARRLIKGDYDRAFGHADVARSGTDRAGSAGAGADACQVILMPTAPAPAFNLGEKLEDPLALYLVDVFTVGVNLAGLPAISIPAGCADEQGGRLPIGMQLIAAPFEESTLLRAARMLERAMDLRADAAAPRR